MKTPPRLATRLLTLALPRSRRADVMGDLGEMYESVQSRRGKTAASIWYWRQALAVPVWLWWEEGGTMLMLGMQEIRIAARSLLRRPGFVAVTVVTLAVAMGANTAIYSVVHGVLLAALPFPEADRLVTITHTTRDASWGEMPGATGLHELYAKANHSFAGLALFGSRAANLMAENRPERISVGLATPSLFRVLEQQPLLGRTFTEQEGWPGGADVVILAHALWTDLFGRDPDVVGESVRIDGRTRKIVGVMGPGFEIPNWHVDAWTPLQIDPHEAHFGGFNYQAIGRLRPGVTGEEARQDLQGLVPRIPDRLAFFTQVRLEEMGLRINVKPFLDTLVGPLRTTLWLLMATVGIVLLIACMNIANLVLARAEGRAREVAVRTALGASRPQLVLRFMAESALLAVAGGGLGILAAFAGLHGLLSLGARALPRADTIAINGPVLTFTGVMVLLVTLAFGAIPLARLRGGTAPSVLRGGMSAAVGTRNARGARHVLVASQVALALVLLTGSALMVRSLRALQHVDPGFVPANVLTFRVSLPTSDYPTAAEAADFHQRFLDRLNGMAGVEVAGAVTRMPLTGASGFNPLSVEGRAYAAGAIPPMVESRAVTPGFFRALDIPLLEGRMLERSDADQRSGAVLVSQAVGSLVFPGEDPLGHLVAHSTPNPHDGWSRIVGVVGDVHTASLTEESPGILYFAIHPGEGVQKAWLARSMSYAVRTSVPPMSLVPAIKETLRSMDPAVPLAEARLLDDITRSAQAQMRLMLALIGTAGSLGLLLAIVGLYGVISYLTAQRTREIGVRVALGAKGRAVRGMVIREGMLVTVAGLGGGLVAAWFLTRFMAGLIFEVNTRDPVTLVSVAVGLGAVSLLATWIPAARASRIDPVEALRSD